MYDLIVSCLLFHIAAATTLVVVHAISEVSNATRPRARQWQWMNAPEDFTLALLSTRIDPRNSSASAPAETERFQSRAA